jgi:hypothetical protein
MNQHFQKHGDEYLLSPGAVLLITSDALRSGDTSVAGKERSVRVINQVMAVARGMKLEQADASEAMLLFGAEPARLLTVCEAVVQRIGGWAVVAIVQNSLRTIPPGDAA